MESLNPQSVDYEEVAQAFECYYLNQRNEHYVVLWYILSLTKGTNIGTLIPVNYAYSFMAIWQFVQTNLS